MISPRRTALHDPEDHAILGFILEDVTGWQAQTIFGYTISRTATKEAAEYVLRTNDMGYLNPDDYKMYTIKEPSDNTLVKA